MGRAPARPPLPDGAQQRLAARQAARAAADWVTADRLRDELAALGVSVSDTAGGQEWTVRPLPRSRQQRIASLRVQDATNRCQRT